MLLLKRNIIIFIKVCFVVFGNSKTKPCVGKISLIQNCT